jgi:4-carboxymuconolactone decarboxylase
MGAATPARLAPLEAADLDDDTRPLLSPDGPFPGATGLNWFATIARHPGLYRKFLPFAGKLTFGGRLPARDREVLVLRTAWLCRAGYEWAHHLHAAREAGMSADEIAVIAGGHPDAAGDDGPLLRAADELHEHRALSDATWTALRERYGDRELIEVVFLCGTYQLVAMAMSAFGVALEPQFEPPSWPTGW